VKNRSSFWLLIFLFPLLIAGCFYWWGRGLRPVGTSAEKIFFTINRGDGLIKISNELKKEGLIKDAFHFRIFSLILGTAKNIKAGGYYLSSTMTPREISQILTKGIDDKWVTIIEGLRSEEICRQLIQSGFAINPNEWENKVKLLNLEGKLFPDSYLIPQEANLEKIIQIIQSNFEKKVLDSFKNEINSNNLTLNEILTLASIIEKEAKIDSDRRIVAGILLKRTRNSWPLQVDATIQYAVASNNCSILQSPCDWWKNRTTYEDLKIISQYNTYLHKGLPPGPICNPGISSIKAVLNSEETDFWYYISDNKGILHFASTSDEHYANIQKYLR